MDGVKGRPSRGLRRWAAPLAVAGLLLAFLLVALTQTGALATAQGCPPDDQESTGDGCFGPEGSYRTLFGATLSLQTGHAVTAGALSLVLLAGLTALHGRGAVRVPWPWRVAAGLVAAGVLFVALVYAAPVAVTY